MSLPYNRHLCWICGIYHKNGSKAQKRCEEETERAKDVRKHEQQNTIEICKWFVLEVCGIKLDWEKLDDTMIKNIKNELMNNEKIKMFTNHGL